MKPGEKRQLNPFDLLWNLRKTLLPSKRSPAPIHQVCDGSNYMHGCLQHCEIVQPLRKVLAQFFVNFVHQKISIKFAEKYMN